ncbi:MAG: nuclear transport factor 2 family protein [Halobacteriota archaeon]
MDATFTTNGRLVRPNGVALAGREAILNGQNKSFARFRATHHIITDHVIDFDGDAARLRANLTAMHLWSNEESDPNSLQTHFVAGGVFHVLAVAHLRRVALQRTVTAQYMAHGCGFVRNGSIECTRLLEYNLSDPQQVAEAKKSKVVVARCPAFVRDAVELVETLV